MPPQDDLGRESIVARTGTVASGPPGSSAAPGPAAPPPRKYTVEATVGMGGMGEVLLVTDNDLRRQIAMKVIRRDLAAADVHKLRFIAEAQATSQLEHPGIPPVHDLGLTADGALYFTMKLVRGRTLREVLKDLLLEVREARREYTLHRLVTVLERVAEAVHFAHEKGVIHRDLKPDNIMLGSYGEVHVMDWGLARLMDAPPDDSSGERRVDIETSDGELATQAGVIKGTIPYMSPEQAEGKPGDIGRGTDVYALGCILYEVLTLHIAFEGRGKELLERVRRGAHTPVEERNPRRPVPEALAALCRASMAPDPAARPPTARDFARRLREWLDGTSEKDRRHRTAEDLAGKGMEAAARFRGLETTLAAAEKRVEEEERRFHPHQPVSEKGPLLEARAERDGVRRDKVHAFAEAIRLLDAALLEEEGNATARRAVADLWHGRLVEAEGREDPDDAAFALNMIRRYDDGRLGRVVKGEGSLSLRSSPEGVEVTLVPLLDRHGILVEGEHRPLGRTPIRDEPLAMGSYLCLLRLGGYHEVRFPVWIPRNHHWEGTARLRLESEFDEGWIHVPGGPFLFGRGRTAREAAVADFLIQREPVTFGDYAEFLEALEKESGPEEAAKRIPSYARGPFMLRTAEGRYRVQPDIAEGRTRERCLRDHGEGFEHRLPAIGVSFEDAAAYCAWRTSVTGQAWRLPTEEEREKAGRGVDGRLFPWGSLADASLAKCRDARDEPAQPEPVGTFPSATSVYGLVDAAGGAWEWTDSWNDLQKRERVMKGGAWNSILGNLACAVRVSYAPTLRTAVSGFRCARDLR